MTEVTMRESLDKAAEDIKRLIDEEGSRIVADMADSFVQQAKEDEEGKLKYRFSISVTVTPNDNVMMVQTKITNGLKRTVIAESVAG